jgi:hypothetical protein
LPERDDVDCTVSDLESLSALTTEAILTSHPEYKNDHLADLLVRVVSLDQNFKLQMDYQTCLHRDGSTQIVIDGDEVVMSAIEDAVWLRWSETRDHPQRKAVDRLMRIARAEEQL